MAIRDNIFSLVILAISLCCIQSTSFAQEMFFADNDDGVSEAGFQGSEGYPANMVCEPPLGTLGGSSLANVGDSASSGVLGSDSNLYTVLSFDTIPMAVGSFALKLSEFNTFGDAFGKLGKVTVEFITSEETLTARDQAASAGYTVIGRYSRDELFHADGIDISNAINSVLNMEDHQQFIFIRIRFETCQNGDNMGDAFRIAMQGDPGRAHILGTASGVLPADGSLAGSWYLDARDGEGAIIDMWDSAGERRVVLYLYTFTNDGSGEQLYLVGAGSIVGDQVLITMHQTRGPTFGPDYDKDDFIIEEWGTVTIIFVACNEIQIVYDSPTYGTGTLTMNRLGLPIQGVTGVCSG